MVDYPQEGRPATPERCTPPNCMASPSTENEVSITFSKEEMYHIICPLEDALVITTEIDGYDVKRVLIDLESSTDVLFLDALKIWEGVKRI